MDLIEVGRGEEWEETAGAIVKYVFSVVRCRAGPANAPSMESAG